MPYDALDLIDDPLGSLVASSFDRNMNADPFAPRKKRKRVIQELDPEEEDSLLASLGKGTMSGLAFAGGQLDKFTGSRALRGLLGGKPRELASLLPFSDSLGITDPADIVHGTDLIGAPKDTSLFSPEGALGFALEVGLDPTLPFTGFLKGGLTAAGKTLKAAGGLEKAIAGTSRAANAAGKFVGPRVAKMTTTIGKHLDSLAPAERAAAEVALHRAAPKHLIDLQPLEAAKLTAQEMGVKDADAFVDLMAKTTKAEKASHVKGLDPISGQWLDAHELEKQFAKEGVNVPMGAEYSRRRGYSPMEISDWTRHQQQIADATASGLKADDLFGINALAAGTVKRQGLPRSLLDMPLGGNLEFWPTGSVIGKAGGVGEKVASGMDWVGDALRYGNIPKTNYSPGRHLAQLFEGRSGGLGTKEMQQAYGRAHDETQALLGDAMQPVYRGVEDLSGMPHDPRAVMRDLESGGSQYADVFGPIQKHQNKNFGEGWLQGSFKTPLDDEFAKYAPRRANIGPNFRKGIDSAEDFGEQVIETRAGAARKRSDALRHIVGGGDRVNDMLADPAIKFAKNADEVERRLQTHWSFQLPKHTPEDFEALADTLQAFKKSHNFDPASVYTGGGDLPNFWRHPMEAAAVSSASATRRVRNHKAIFEGLTDAAKELANTVKAGGSAGETVRLGDALSAGNIFHGEDGVIGGLPEMARRMGIPGPPPGATDKQLAAWRKSVADIPVPKQHLEDVKRIKGMFDAPEEVNKALQGLDSFNSMFKAGVLAWPAFHARNFVSAKIQDMVTGEFSGWSNKLADQFVKGKQIDALQFPAVKSLLDADKLAHTQENANRVLRAHLAAVGLISPGHATQSQIAQQAGRSGIKTLAELEQRIPGRKPMGIGPSLAEWKKGDLNPLNIKGVLGREHTTFKPMKVNEAFGNYVDALTRLPPYLNMLKRGVDPQEALAKVLASQVDYSAKSFSPFENSVMKRVAPFYSFSRKMSQFVLKELADKPSGRLAQVVRGQSRAREKDQFVPSHIAQTTAMPIPGGVEGTQRFLTSLGLMHEDPLGLVRPGNTAFKTASGTAQELVGKLNPLLKAPIELAFGTQAFTGRDLEDLEGNVGQIAANLTGRKQAYDTPPLLEHALSNSPASRLLTTARTLSDPRKGPLAKAANLLTGLRVSDVDKEKSRNIAIREGIEDTLKGQAGVRTLRPHLYVKEEDLDQLSPKEQALLRMYKTLAAKSQKAAAEKR